MTGTVAFAHTEYSHDFHAWTVAQATALRAAAENGIDTGVDWESVIEEIETLGRCEERQAASAAAIMSSSTPPWFGG